MASAGGPRRPFVLEGRGRAGACRPWALVGVSALLAAWALAPAAARAQDQGYFDPATSSCELGLPCAGDVECLATPETPRCLEGRCRPLTFFECCAPMMVCPMGVAATVMAGPMETVCLCVPPELSACFTASTNAGTRTLACTHNGASVVTNLLDGDCDGDGCANRADRDPCSPMPGMCSPDGDGGVPPADAGLDMGPRDGGTDMGPRDGGLDATVGDGGPRDGGRDAALALDMGPRDGGRDAAFADAARPDASPGDAGPECPTVPLAEERCGPDGHGDGCDDDLNGLIDDGCGEAPVDAGPEEDAGEPPPGEDAGEPPPEEDAGAERDAATPPAMDAATEPATDPRTFRGSGGCGACAVGARHGDGGLPSGLEVLSLGLVLLLLRRRARRRP